MVYSEIKAVLIWTKLHFLIWSFINLISLELTFIFTRLWQQAGSRVQSVCCTQTVQSGCWVLHRGAQGPIGGDSSPETWEGVLQPSRGCSERSKLRGCYKIIFQILSSRSTFMFCAFPFSGRRVIVGADCKTKHYVVLKRINKAHECISNFTHVLR